MADPTSPGKARLDAVRARALATYRSHRFRKSLLILAIVLVLFGLFGFLAGPSIIKSQIEKRATAALDRPVTLGKVSLNPYTLRLDLDQLHVGDRDGKSAFVDIDHVTVNTSWTSVFRLAPVLDELTLQRPRLRIVRTADQRFNFTDLIEKFASGPTDPNAKPARFALSNISVHGGDIDFDDQAGGARHKVEQLELGIPFLANLPSSTDVFVQPLLAMRVDGSPLEVKGQTKPFAESRDSTMDFKLDHLDLARYMGYVPTPLPIAIPKGLLSGDLSLHFLEAKPTPTLQLTGNLQVDDFVLNSSKGEAIFALTHGQAQLTDVQPLASRYFLGALKLDGAQLHYTQGVGGSSNFDTLLQKTPPPADAKAEPAAPNDVRIAALELTNSAIHYTDANAQKLDITSLHGAIQALSLQKAPPAKLKLDGQLFGGQIHAQGTIDLAASKMATTLGLKQVDMPPLQAVAAPPFAARVQQGKLDATGPVQLDWSKEINVAMGPAQAAISDFALEPQFKGHGSPVAWSKLEAEITKVDLATREARLGTVTGTNVQLDIERNSNNYISIVDLFAEKTNLSKARKQAASKGKELETPWRWSIDKLVLGNGGLKFTDMAAGPEPVKLKLDALNGSIEHLSDNFAQPRDMKLEGKLDRGTFTATGKVQPLPTLADLQLTFRQFDITSFAPYISVPLNVVISRARISGNGKLHYDGRKAEPQFTYRGNASLDRVRVQDKVTGDDFLRWNTLNASNLDVSYGVGAPRMHVGALTLSSFYARMIINADGRLNLSDVVQKEQTAVSVTRAEPTAATKAPVVTPKQPQQATVAATGPAADISIGGLTLINGQLNYTDNFIKPNYTANLTHLTGKIGAFSTSEAGPPADLALQASLDEDSPVDINGTINPLAPVAALDIKGKADEVELTRLSAYSSKYTGYPITQGKLSVDVHYVLDQNKLKADNHIFITQLTFGDRDDSPGVSHLPVKLAVALLKDTQGNIDVNVPVSGSLDDPQFSMGGLIWRAIGNLIAKAATAPFRLLGAAFGGSEHEDLGYVEFDPGSAVLDDQATQRMEKVVKMLEQKTALTLDIVGRVDPSKDQNGLRKVTVDNLVRKEKVLDENGKDADTSDAALAKVEITPDQFERYLKRAYKHSEIDKPKNVIGLSKSLEPDEMRSLMETSVSVDDKAMHDLAERRAQAVRDWFKGKIDDKRVSVKDVKLNAEGIDDKGKTTRVDFGLH